MNQVKVGGKQLIVKYGLSATDAVLNLIGVKNLADVGEVSNLPLQKWAEFVHEGIKGGAIASGENTVVSIDDVKKQLDIDMDLFYQCQEYFLLDVVPSKSREQLKKVISGSEEVTEEEIKKDPDSGN